ncbi:TetR/AcrR family transcriptional regulator [Pelotomaculum propionicicum]|nr:TetR/AcrR family transcriptional regulator [Pelotomaculum propionicicum]NLI14212.1 TetR/AcrR family transcriptional regulator [Peptococcaceae bacterium]
MPESQRQKQKKQTRKHLITMAFNQLAKDGLINTRTADIAKAAGVSHGTVFAHFPTRDALLTEVINEFGARVTRRLHELAGGGSVHEILEAHLKGLAEFEPFYTRLVREGSLLPESARNTLIMIQSAVSFHLSQAAEREMAAGIIRRLPMHLLFNTWIGLVHYYLANGDLFSPGKPVLERYGKELLEHYLTLITE